MDFKDFLALVNTVSDGGPTAIIAILMALIVGLIFERRRLVADLAKKDERIDRIVDDYHRGNLSLAEALGSLRIVLYEIKSKF